MQTNSIRHNRYLDGIKPEQIDRNYVCQELEKILSSDKKDGTQKEQTIQDFFEEHTELFCLHNTFKNFYHHDMVITKCPIDILKTDYVYITKKSDQWRIVFGEFELPDSNFFLKGSDTNYTQEFNHATQQIQSWKSIVSTKKNEVIDYFKMLLIPERMRDNPIEFKYELIYGRSADKNKTEARRRMINQTASTLDIDIMSFDSVMNELKETRFIDKKNVVKYNSRTIEYKKLHMFPNCDFQSFNNEQLILSKAQRDILISKGVQLDLWDQGVAIDSFGLKERTTEEWFKERLEER